MKTPAEWKAFYKAVRERLNLRHLLESAPEISLNSRSALVFPHTRMEVTGHMTAAVAKAIARHGGEVLAIGVLHGPNDLPRGIHSSCPGEFSLDNLRTLVELAGGRIIERYPTQVGDDPSTLPGIEELRAMVKAGMPVVATADPIHHGVGYGTTSSMTEGTARASIEKGFRLLADRNYAEFAHHCRSEKSDFKNAGPVLAELLEGSFEVNLRELRLVDYSEALDCGKPTWVAGALAEFRRR